MEKTDEDTLRVVTEASCFMCAGTGVLTLRLFDIPPPPCPVCRTDECNSGGPP